MTSDLLAIGEAMAEIRRSPEAGFAISYAGDTLNTAIYCARCLPDSMSTAYLTRIGMDPLSESFIETAEQEGLVSDFIETDPNHNIGIYAVSTDVTGERSFSYWRSDSAARQLFSAKQIELPQARIVYLSGITLAILPQLVRERLLSKLKLIKSEGESLIAFDSNYRPALWESVEVAQSVMSSMWEIADIALPSIDDEMTLFAESDEDSVISRFASKTWTACAIKRGSNGPISPKLSASEHPEFEPANIVTDTTGAGDSFNGAYLAAFLQGHSEEQCLISGHIMASKVVGVRGAIMAKNKQA